MHVAPEHVDCAASCSRSAGALSVDSANHSAGSTRKESSSGWKRISGANLHCHRLLSHTHPASASDAPWPSHMHARLPTVQQQTGACSSTRPRQPLWRPMVRRRLHTRFPPKRSGANWSQALKRTSEMTAHQPCAPNAQAQASPRHAHIPDASLHAPPNWGGDHFSGSVGQKFVSKAA